MMSLSCKSVFIPSVCFLDSIYEDFSSPSWRSPVFDKCGGMGVCLQTAPEWLSSFFGFRFCLCKRYLFFGCVGSLLLCGLFSLWRARVTLWFVVHGLLSLRSTVPKECRLQYLQPLGSRYGSWALSAQGLIAAHGLSYSVACGIFLD